MRTQVAIIGSGPAGLLLRHLLCQAEIDVVERYSAEHVSCSRAAQTAIAENYVGLPI